MNRKDVENSARKLIGSQWHHQGRDINAGIDCIGGIIFIGKDTGYFTEKDIKEFDLLNYSREPDAFATLVVRLKQYLDEIPLEEAREGDILAFRMAGEKLTSHVGTLVKGYREMMLVHSLECKTTIEEPLARWIKFRTFAFRFRGIED